MYVYVCAQDRILDDNCTSTLLYYGVLTVGCGASGDIIGPPSLLRQVHGEPSWIELRRPDEKRRANTLSKRPIDLSVE